MLFPLSADDLTDVLPPESVLRTDPVVAAEVLGDPAAVAFLSAVGLPWCGGLFQLSAELADAATLALADNRVIESGGAPGVVETELGELGSLGSLGYTLVYVRRADGVVVATSESTDAEYEVLHTDVSSLAAMLLMIEQRTPAEALDYAEGLAVYGPAAKEIEARVRAVDPAPFADDRGFWRNFIDEWSVGMF
ncbi:SUKH-4 family immunity protein [Kitasatospora sp. NPDC058965]|uniref:SUKH-4 family immunity protein n=1 Tax=Kitasatospora sp. NPDC058965 TaxID=3346682 RepID=UPI0036D1AA77